MNYSLITAAAAHTKFSFSSAFFFVLSVRRGGDDIVASFHPPPLWITFLVSRLSLVPFFCCLCVLRYMRMAMTCVWYNVRKGGGMSSTPAKKKKKKRKRSARRSGRAGGRTSERSGDDEWGADRVSDRGKNRHQKKKKSLLSALSSQLSFSLSLSCTCVCVKERSSRSFFHIERFIESGQLKGPKEKETKKGGGNLSNTPATATFALVNASRSCRRLIFGMRVHRLTGPDGIDVLRYDAIRWEMDEFGCHCSAVNETKQVFFLLLLLLLLLVRGTSLNKVWLRSEEEKMMTMTTTTTIGGRGWRGKTTGRVRDGACV